MAFSSPPQVLTTVLWISRVKIHIYEHGSLFMRASGHTQWHTHTHSPTSPTTSTHSKNCWVSRYSWSKLRSVSAVSEPRKGLRQEFLKVWSDAAEVMKLEEVCSLSFNGNGVYQTEQQTCSPKSMSNTCNIRLVRRLADDFTLWALFFYVFFLTSMTSSWLNVSRIYWCLLALPTAFNSCCYLYSSVPRNDLWWISWFSGDASAVARHKQTDMW